MKKWKPINTAPKDNIDILVCNMNPNFYYPETAFFGTYHPNAKGKPQWRSRNNNCKINPTHWMDLPEKEILKV